MGIKTSTETGLTDLLREEFFRIRVNIDPSNRGLRDEDCMVVGDGYSIINGVKNKNLTADDVNRSRWLRENMMHYDEDVNIYLTGLLNSLTRSRRMHNIISYVSSKPINIMISEISDQSNRVKYEFFKANGEYIMVSVGFFRKSFSKEPKGLEYRGSILYSMAANSLKRLKKRRTGLVDVFDKIHYHGVGRYAKILRRMAAKFPGMLDDSNRKEIEKLTEAKPAYINPKDN